MNNVIFDYTLKLLSSTFDSIKSIEIKHNELKKTIWLASILSNSDNDIHKRKAQLFTSLLFLNNQDDIEILKACYVLFSRLGNLTATRFLKNLYSNQDENPVELKSEYNFGDFLSYELLFEREKKIISLENNSFLVTDFQKDLWEGLNNISEIAISAPTSSGKSFIIKKYLINEFFNKNEFRALYIVPSRALINQVSEEFKSELTDDVRVKSSVTEENEVFDKEIYILTPERCIKILDIDIKIDFIFIDEVQGIEDALGRGLIFEYVFNEISLKFPSAKFISAGPNITNPNKTFTEIFERDCSTIQSKLSPVFQLKITLKNNQGSKFDVVIQNESGIYQKFVQDFKYNFKNKNKGETVAQLVKYIAPKDSNIVFVHDGYYAQHWAVIYASIIEEDDDLDKEVKELIDFLKEDIHKKYYLIECLKKKIAYHHSTLPDIVRKEIEELYTNEKISTIYCTSTLLEGINLPANNLFTFQPKKKNIPLTKFEFGNLIGRAGRIKSSLYGSIYYIQNNNDSQLASDYYDAEYDKEIEVFSSNAINSLDVHDLNIPTSKIEKGSDIETKKAQQISIFLKHKYLKGEDYALKYLKNKKFTDEEISIAMGYLKDNLNAIDVPPNVLIKNPSIDPLLQNQLYTKIKSDDIREWVLSKTSNFAKFLDPEKIETLPIYDRPFYWQLVNLLGKLDEIFNMFDEGFKKYNQKWLSATSTSLQAKRWLSGAPIGQIIKQNIEYLSGRNNYNKIDPENLEDINRVINDTIRYNSTITTYLLPKYVKVLVDILNEIFTDEQKEEYKLTMSLPTMLELGTKEPLIIQLISSGITRSVAIQIFDLYNKNTTKDFREKNDILNWLSNQRDIKELKPIYNRYLKRIKVLAT
ncbi:DEAD/DEAH box helicase [Chryseobacterium hagamense]|uniref:DEAD/DEAH box helicase n=1 Tax=Chryseobacterium hagamense TaxID=395935 RepID=UPI0014790B98|nr:DEAD/DEAH box helicase [Chryseobacterium hagamense]